MAEKYKGHLIHEIDLGWVCSRCLRIRQYKNRYGNVDCELVNPYAAVEELNEKFDKDEKTLNELLTEIRDSLRRIEDALASQKPRRVEIRVSSANNEVANHGDSEVVYVTTQEQLHEILSGRTKSVRIERAGNQDPIKVKPRPSDNRAR